MSIFPPVENGSNDRPILVRLMSQRGPDGFAGLKSRLPNNSLDQGDIIFSFDEKPDPDVVVVQNYLKYDTYVTARKGYVWKWDNEPIVQDPSGRGYDKVFSHLNLQDPRYVTAPPILDWWVGKSYPELVEMAVPNKTALISAIASTKDWIPGHRSRSEFIDVALTELPELEVFGRGRPNELKEKWNGLAPYRYSIAIENTSKRDYWTEKIADCFLSFTVPFYFGATNTSDYFPKESFIWIPIDDPASALEVILHELDNGSWVDRLPALREARHRVLDEFSLGAQIMARIRAERERILTAPVVKRGVHGRRTKPGGWHRSAGLTVNLKSQFRRFQRNLGHAQPS